MESPAQIPKPFLVFCWSREPAAPKEPAEGHAGRPHGLRDGTGVARLSFVRVYAGAGLGDAFLVCLSVRDSCGLATCSS